MTIEIKAFTAPGTFFKLGGLVKFVAYDLNNKWLPVYLESKTDEVIQSR